MQPRRRIAITFAGLCYLGVLCFLFTGAMLRDINLMMLMFGMMACPYVYNWRSVRISLARLELLRRMPRRIAVGDLIEVAVEATSRHRWFGSWAVSVEDTIRREGDSSAAEPLRARLLIPRISHQQTVSMSYRGRLLRRGRYHFGPWRYSTAFPFGLVRATVSDPRPATLTVIPRLGRLTRRWWRFQQTAQRPAQATRALGVVEGDFHSLRDYRPGDSRRWIHWRTSARRGALIVRQFAEQRNQDLTLVLELWRPPTPNEAELAAVEAAVSFAATIAAELCGRGGSHLQFACACDKPSLVSHAASSALLDDILESLALAEATPTDRLPESLGAALATVRPGRSVILISTRPVDLADTERFVEIWEDPRRRATLSRILTVDASSAQLAEYFQPQ
ncbi:MAG: DUF58 domain-containing protein [Pirellulales bacterium]|nr:DUF58 domain-containing protein [Pirellulales bacterium]